ncbi:DUF6531 domain-containing protein [Silvimonas amylolytica]|uniref:YD repeat-containing protein n=1 Tax=Silvimonas amylolytica TaxID=449663 RepID=A0ABQ2PJ79_9NEIS|nr:DUF6531 domain-containing protein [Silvimonas amylolytica]GGP25405.1 hypothetical protein GCM10010971_12240 [Silvimonas amylolytica]
MSDYIVPFNGGWYEYTIHDGPFQPNNGNWWWHDTYNNLMHQYFYDGQGNLHVQTGMQGYDALICNEAYPYYSAAFHNCFSEQVPTDPCDTLKGQTYAIQPGFTWMFEGGGGSTLAASHISCINRCVVSGASSSICSTTPAGMAVCTAGKNTLTNTGVTDPGCVDVYAVADSVPPKSTPGGGCGCDNDGPGNSGSVTRNDPVSIGTREQVESVLDIANLGPAPLTFRRTYSSLAGGDPALGYGWRHNYSARLFFYPDSTGNGPVMLVRSNGQYVQFDPTNSGGANGDQTYSSNPDVNDTLVKTTDPFTQFAVWILRHPNRTVETFDINGRLQRITNAAGLSVWLSYDGQGRLIFVTDPFNRSLRFGYKDLTLQIRSITDVAGGTTNYSYSPAGSLESVTYPDGGTIWYSYDETNMPYQLISITDPNGIAYVSLIYDHGSSAHSQRAGGADALEITGSGSTVVATDGLGSVTTYSFTTIADVPRWQQQLINCGASCTGATLKANYDTAANLLSLQDGNGVVTTYTYDLTRNLETSRTEASGTSQARTITTTWHSTFRLPTQITEPNRVTSFTYDASGNLLTKSVAAGGKTRTWAYTWNGFGQVLTATDPDNNKTTYTYDASGNLTSLTDAASHVTQYTSYDANGNLLSMTDPNGKVSAFTWDARNRLKTRQDGSDLTTYVYDPVGQLIQVTLPDSSTVTYSYDPAHRLTGVSDSRGNSITYTLDAMGNHTREDVTDPAGQLAAAQTQVMTSQQTTGVMQ